MDVMSFKRYQELGGSLPESDFRASIAAATAAVKDEIWPHEPKDKAEEEAVERAIAACVECDAAWGGTSGASGPASFSIGSFSMSGSSGSASTDYAADMRSAARRYLVGTSLLSKVVR